MVRTLVLDESDAKNLEHALTHESLLEQTHQFVVERLGYLRDEIFEVPAEEDFTVLDKNEKGEEVTVDRNWIDAPILAAIGEELIERRQDTLAHLNPFKIAYFWRKKGGLESGRYRYGQTLVPSGLLKEKVDADFIIWLASDYTSSYFEAWRIEALLYHQLLHAGANATTGGPKLRPHQFEGFGSELEHYGAWSPPLKIVARAAQQLPLFDQDGGSE